MQLQVLESCSHIVCSGQQIKDCSSKKAQDRKCSEAPYFIHAIGNDSQLRNVFSLGTNPTARARDWGKCRAYVLIRGEAKLAFTAADKEMEPADMATALLKLI